MGRSRGLCILAALASKKNEKTRKIKEALLLLNPSHSSSSSFSRPFKSLTGDKSSYRKSKYGVEDNITAAAFFISVFSLLLLPIPTLIFANRPCFFHAFVLGLNLAFFGGAISLRQLYPGVARVRRLICVSLMLVAVGISAGLFQLLWNWDSICTDQSFFFSYSLFFKTYLFISSLPKSIRSFFCKHLSPLAS